LIAISSYAAVFHVLCFAVVMYRGTFPVEGAVWKLP